MTKFLIKIKACLHSDSLFFSIKSWVTKSILVWPFCQILNQLWPTSQKVCPLLRWGRRKWIRTQRVTDFYFGGELYFIWVNAFLKPWLDHRLRWPNCCVNTQSLKEMNENKHERNRKWCARGSSGKEARVSASPGTEGGGRRRGEWRGGWDRRAAAFLRARGAGRTRSPRAQVRLLQVWLC